MEIFNILVHIHIYKLCIMYIGDSSNQKDIIYNRSLYLEKFKEQTHLVKCTVCVARMHAAIQQAGFLKLRM